MAISRETILKELKEKGFYEVDISTYKNLKSPILIKCENDHTLETNFESIRKASFRCPLCEGSQSFEYAAKIPEKNGFRVVGIDNASQNMGVSVFDDGKLVFYSLLRFRNPLFENRLAEIFSTVSDVIADQWKPDYIVFEDIQYQNNFNTYKKLAMLLGSIIVAAKINNIKHEEVPPVRWRSHFQISGTRAVAKQKAISLVQTMYNISVSDDIAEAILIGKYSSDQLLKNNLKKGF